MVFCLLAVFLLCFVSACSDKTEIEEPEIPLGDAPATGDETNAVPFMALMMFAFAGLIITRRRFN